MSHYCPLPTPTTIRLLELHPGAENEEVNVSLLLDDLDAPKYPYQALSYFWGPPEFSRGICVEGKDMYITQTLYDALIALRLSEGPRVIWADAISIDQGSTAEKNHQVQLMGRIFKQCVKCIVYLGPHADGSELVLDFVHYIRRWQEMDSESADPAWKSYELPPARDRRWFALRSFIRRPWFRRLWVVQEFALPKKVTIAWGNTWVDGARLTLILLGVFVPNIIQLTGDASGVDDTARKEVEVAFASLQWHFNLRLELDSRWRSERQAPVQEENRGFKSSLETLEMVALLESSRDCEVTDPRDRFFALLSLANDIPADPDLAPDYSKSPRQIQDAYHAHFIRQGFGAELLSTVVSPETPDLSRPSWMTMGSLNSRAFPGLRSAILAEGVFPPDRSRSGDAVSQNSSVSLAVSGFLVDGLGIMTTNRSEVYFKILEEVLSMELECPSPSGESLKRTVLRVLSLNRTDTGLEPLPEDYFDILESQLDHIRAPELSMLMSYLVRSGMSNETLQQWSDTKKALSHSWGLHFGVTKEGYFGMFPPTAQMGDQIFMIDGVPRTFLVRHQPESNTYRWLSEVYVYNFEEQVRGATQAHHRTTLIVP